MSGQHPAPAALLLERSPGYSLDRRLSGPQNRSGRRGEEKIIDPPGIQNPTPPPPPVVHPIASRYTDRAIPTPLPPAVSRCMGPGVDIREFLLLLGIEPQSSSL
jgi:hypothetical protein